MKINVENITRLVRDGAYTHHVFQAFGEAGTTALTRLLDGLRLIYAVCPPDQLRQGLTVFCSVEGDNQPQVLPSHLEATNFTDIRDLARFILDNTTISECMIELLNDQTYSAVLLNSSDCNFDNITNTSVVYRYEVNQKAVNQERILASDYDGIILRASPALASNFAEPTHSSLEDALNQYRETASKCKCKILQPAWEGGVSGPRLVLVNRPESIMRDSLDQFLQTLLGTKASVRPEQNTDETKPVDIRIEWFGSDASALIEIKWLGRSTSVSRDGTKNTYTDYKPARAKSGAKQLCGYLDRDGLHTRSIKPLGYLVVFDARRKNVQGASDALCREDAFWFENEEIDYSPKFEDERDDFVAPIRFFMRPRESNLLVDG